MKRRLPALIIVLVIVALVVAGVIVSNQQSRSALIHTYTGSPTAFSFQYPDGWQVSIPIQNILLLADAAAQRGEPGATFTVQRSTALADEGSLGAALNTYLRQGALRPDVKNSSVLDPARLARITGSHSGSNFFQPAAYARWRAVCANPSFVCAEAMIERHR